VIIGLSPLGFCWIARLFLSLQSLTSSTSLSPLAGQFYRILKQSVISPLHTLDKDELSNYRANSITNVSCLCVLDLSAAFHTLDCNIVITRLSFRFRIHGSVLCWFKSYLSSRSFRVKCNINLSSLHTSSCGVPRGSVPSPLLSIMYTTPLSTLIFSLSLDHYFCADDTQLFFFFHQINFDSTVLTFWVTAKC